MTTDTGQTPIVTGPGAAPTPRLDSPLTPGSAWTRYPLYLLLLAVVAHGGLGLLIAFGANTEQDYLDIGSGIYTVGVSLGAVFWLVYSVLARWWRAPIGVMFWLIGLATTATGVTVLLSLYLGLNYPGREVVRVIGYLLFTDAEFALLTVYLVERRNPASSLPAMDRRKLRAFRRLERAARKEARRG